MSSSSTTDRDRYCLHYLVYRENGIRTHDLCVPNAALYQAELFPEEIDQLPKYSIELRK